MELTTSGKIKLAVTGVLVILLLIFIGVNFEKVEVDLLVAELRVPLAVLIIASALTGFLIGWIIKSFFWSGKKKK